MKRKDYLWNVFVLLCILLLVLIDCGVFGVFLVPFLWRTTREGDR